MLTPTMSQMTVVTSVAMCRCQIAIISTDLHMGS